MIAYYNENDPYAAQWLRNLIEAGHIAPGDVDERSIVDVRADDLRGYEQCHFFAGIGGWSYALRLAGWPDDRPVWTGSCPCQPFSAAGAGKAANDERHLWPAWFPLIRESHPATIFGEQVEASIGWGWIDLVFADLEEEGYACGQAVLPACSVGAPHIRQRLWFVADANGRNAGTEGLQRSGQHGQREEDGRVNGMADAVPTGWPQRRPIARDRPVTGRSEPSELGHPNIAELQGRRLDAGKHADQCPIGQASQPSVLGDTTLGGIGPLNGQFKSSNEQQEPTGRSGLSFWHDLKWLSCTDGKARPIKPGIFPLAHGISARMGKLRAAGNAIVPQLAAEFIKAATE